MNSYFLLRSLHIVQKQKTASPIKTSPARIRKRIEPVAKLNKKENLRNDKNAQDETGDTSYQNSPRHHLCWETLNKNQIDDSNADRNTQGHPHSIIKCQKCMLFMKTTMVYHCLFILFISWPAEQS